MGNFSNKIIKAFWGIDINSLNDENTRLKHENSRISELLNNTSKEYNILNEKFKKAESSISDYGTTNENNLNELENCKKELENYKKQVETFTIENGQLKEDISNSDKKYAELNNKYDACTKNCSDLKVSCENAVSKISELEIIINKFEEEKENLSKNNIKLKEEKENLSKSNIKLEEEKENLSKSNIKLEEEKENLSKSNIKLEEEKESLSKSNIKLEEEKKDLELKLEEFSINNSNLLDELKAIKAESENKDGENNKSLAEIECLNKHINDYKVQVESLNSNLDKKTSLLEISDKEKNILLEENKKLNEELSNLKNTSDKEKEISDENLTKVKSSLTEKSIELDNALKEKNMLEEKLQKVQAEHIETKTSLEKAEQIIEDLKMSLSELSNISQKEQDCITKESEEYSNKGYHEIEMEEQDTETEVSNDENLSSIDEDEIEKDNFNNELHSITKKFEYVRLTTTIGNQYIYLSKNLILKVGLFDWGIEGKEVITDEILYLRSNCISKMEGLDSPFDSEELICDLNNEESAQQLVESLLTAICTYQPLQISYHDKNGRTTIKNLYHVTFQPTVSKFSLPYKDMFKDMLDENINTEHISAIASNNPEPRNYSIAQIGTIRRFNAYFTTEEGIKTMKDGIEMALASEQQELADLLSSKLPE